MLRNKFTEDSISSFGKIIKINLDKLSWSWKERYNLEYKWWTEKIYKLRKLVKVKKYIKFWNRNKQLLKLGNPLAQERIKLC